MKTSRFLLVALSLGFFATSCALEWERVEADVNDNITVNFGVKTKAAFTDALGLQWKPGDVITWTGKGGGRGTDITISSISGDGYTASADVATADVLGTSGVFRFNSHPSSNEEFEFTLHEGTLDEGTGHLTITQTDAGQINKNIIMLHSGTTKMDIDAEATTVSVQMAIVGSIIRFIPYTTTYGTESVQSITLSSNDYLSGTVGYNYGAGTYRGVNDINWKKIKTYTVELANPFSLSTADSKVNSKGLYIALPANSISGYTITVVTDAAQYVFSTASTLTVAENQVQSIPLNLDSPKATRKHLNVHECKWQGIAQNTEYTPAAIDYHAYTAGGNVLGFHEVWLKGPEEATFVTKPAPPTVWTEFYEPATFTVTDASTGDPVSWCSFAFRTNDSWIIPTCDENTSSSSRKAKVVVTFPSVVNYDEHDYYVTEDTKTLTFYLTQPGKPSSEFSVATTTFNVNYSATSVDIPVHAVNASWTATCSDPGVSLTGDSGSGDGTITASFAANTGTKKTYTVTISTDASVSPNSYDVTINHQAAPDPEAEWLPEYTFNYNGIISDGLGAYLTEEGNTITINVPLSKCPNPFYMHFAHNDKVYLQNFGSEFPDEEGHPGHRAAPYVDGADWTTPVWVASVGTHTIRFTAVGENGATKTITLVVIVTE